MTKAGEYYQQAAELLADGEQKVSYLNEAGRGFYYAGLYSQSEPLFQQALAIYNQVLGEQHPLYATSLNNLASLYYSQGKYEQAEPLFQQALAIRKQVLGEQHPLYAQSLNNLAELYRVQGKYEQAEPLHQQALAIRKQVLGEQHPDTVTSLNNIAVLLDAAIARMPTFQEATNALNQANETLNI